MALHDHTSISPWIRGVDQKVRKVWPQFSFLFFFGREKNGFYILIFLYALLYFKETSLFN